MNREPPVIKPAIEPASDPAHGAAFVFLHGLGDDGHGWENVAEQFQAGNRLPYMQWIFPNATENRDAMTQAWYTPTSLEAPRGRPELADEEDEDGLLRSVTYIESVLDGLTSRGIPPNRIVLGGFSQGCAMSLLTELSGRYSGKLAGVVGLMGYLPIPERIQHLRTEAGLPHVIGEVPMFLAKGGKDRLIPRSVWDRSLKKLTELGISEEALNVHEYPELGHEVSATLLKDLNAWLDQVVPGLD